MEPSIVLHNISLNPSFKLICQNKDYKQRVELHLRSNDSYSQCLICTREDHNVLWGSCNFGAASGGVWVQVGEIH
jgi:hypothetical protein